MPAKSVISTACPCGKPLPYAECCALYHQGRAAPDAETLMRSRYCAYVLDLHDYLLATWAAETRPATLGLSEPRPNWLGLEVKGRRESGNSAEVEFVARYKINGRAQRMHEISSFTRRDGRWYYVDGSFPEAPA